MYYTPHSCPIEGNISIINAEVVGGSGEGGQSGRRVGRVWVSEISPALTGILIVDSAGGVDALPGSKACACSGGRGAGHFVSLPCQRTMKLPSLPIAALRQLHLTSLIGPQGDKRKGRRCGTYTVLLPHTFPNCLLRQPQQSPSMPRLQPSLPPPSPCPLYAHSPGRFAPLPRRITPSPPIPPSPCPQQPPWEFL